MRWRFERFWWVESAFKISIPLLVAGLVVSIVVAAWTFSGGLDACLLGCLALFLLIGSILISDMFSARNQARRRRRAFQGDQEAMPRADLKIKPEQAPDLASEPIELIWRATLLGRCVSVLFYAFAVLMLGIVGLVGWAEVHTIILGIQKSGNVFELPPSQSAGVYALVIMLLLLVVLYGIMLYAFAVLFADTPLQLGKPYGVVASADGILYHPQFGRSRFLRWEEIRLFEVMYASVLTGYYHQRYWLYGERAAAVWWGEPFSKLISPGVTDLEFSRRQQALLNLIAERTSLLPRTFVPKLSLATKAGS